MSALEAPSVPNSDESSDSISAIRTVLSTELDLATSLLSDASCIAAARVSEVVGTRGCRLAACAIAATVKQTGGDAKDWPEGKRIVFGLDGSLVEFYPRFEQRTRDALREILGETVEKRVAIELAKDGSGVGGACLFSTSFSLPCPSLPHCFFFLPISSSNSCALRPGCSADGGERRGQREEVREISGFLVGLPRGAMHSVLFLPSLPSSDGS